MGGYLVSSMGQKVCVQRTLVLLISVRVLESSWLFQIFVRAFDLDERLVGVAFLDVGVFVTSLRSIKNFLVIGDAVKSVWFVAFQVSISIFSTFYFSVAKGCARLTLSRKTLTNSWFLQRMCSRCA